MSEPLMKILRVGDPFESFTIVEQLGVSNTAVVWKGHDHVLDRHVAIKQLIVDAEQQDTDALRDRFRHEADLLKRLTDADTHLVRMLEFVDRPDGLFIVTEYVDGPSLEQLLARDGRPLAARQALGIMGGVALALQTIHGRGLVHRDLKPANVLLPQAGGLKLCDFGLTTLLADQDTMTMGSVRYMAPELFGMNNDAAEPASDLYSLGIMAFEMLAGRTAFQESFRAVLRDPRNQALRWMKWHTNPRAKAPGLTTLNPDIDSTLAELVMRLMEKDPTRRVGTAGELLDAIRRHFAGVTRQRTEQPSSLTDAAPPKYDAPALNRDEPTAPLPKMSRLPFVLSILLAVLLFFGVGAAGYFKMQQAAEDQQYLAEAKGQFDAARQMFDEGRFEAAAEAFQGLLTDWSENAPVGSRTYAVYCRAMLAYEQKKYAEALDLIDEVEGMGDLPNRDQIRDHRLRIEHDRGFALLVEDLEALVESGRHVDALAQIDRHRNLPLSEHEQLRLVNLADMINLQHGGRQFEQLQTKAEALRSEGKHDEAIKLVERIQARRAEPQPQLRALRQRIAADRDFQDLRRRAGLELVKQNPTNERLKEAIGLLEQASGMQGKAGTPETHRAVTRQIESLRSELHYRAGIAAEGRHDYNTARREFETAVKLAQHTRASNGLERIASKQMQEVEIKQGRTAQQEGDYATAIEHYQRAVELGGKDLSERLLQTKVSLRMEKARHLAESGKISEAREAYGNVLRMQPDHREASQALVILVRRQEYEQYLRAGDQMSQRGLHSTAKRSYRQAREIMATHEVAQRLEDAEFNDLIQKALLALESRDWKNARALVRTAARTPAGQRQPERVKTVADQIAEKAPPESGDGEEEG